MPNCGCEETDRQDDRQQAELRHGELGQVGELPGQLTEGVVQRTAELLGQGDGPEPIPGIRLPVHERCTKWTGPERQLEIDSTDRSDQRQGAQRQEPGTQQDAGMNAEDEQANGDSKEQSQGVVADGQAKDDARDDQPTIGGCLRSPAGLLPAHQPYQQEDHERKVEGMGVRVRTQPPRRRRQRYRHAGGHRNCCPAGQTRHEMDGARRGDGHAQKGQDVHPERRLAERSQEQVDQPADKDVRRVAGRMGGAHDRQDGLEFAGVPIGDVGQHARPDQRDHERRDRHGADDRQPPPGALQARVCPGHRTHHPSRLPQVMPQKLIATDMPMSHSARRPTPLPRELPLPRDIPSATSGRAKTTKSLLKR